MRYYVPDHSDGLEPTDFDVYYDIPAETDKGVAARFYIKIERDPERVARLDERQNAVIAEMLQWFYDNRAELRAKGKPVPDSWPD